MPEKAAKLKIEEVIPEYLNGDMQKLALDLVAYLRANKMNPTQTAHNSWKVNYKGSCLCYVRICDAEHYYRKFPDNPPSWVITLYLNYINEYENVIINEKLQDIILNNVGYLCTSCRHCAPGRDVTVLGKEIKGVCAGVPLTWVFDPDETTLNGIKKLLELEQVARTKK